MLKVALSGVKDSSNTVFTLAQAGVGLILIVQAGRILKRVLVTPGAYECTISGLTVTLGSAPAASDMLYAYVQTDATLSLREVTISGLQNSINTAFSLAEAPLAGTNILLFKNGSILEEVSSGPTSIQYAISGTTVTLGLAIPPSDKLRVFLAAPGTGVMTNATLVGNQDSLNTRFSFQSYTLPQGLDPILLVLFDGVLQSLAVRNPGVGQYIFDNAELILGSAPDPATSLRCLIVGNTPTTVNRYTFTNNRLARKLGILLQRRLDEPELEEVVANTYRQYCDMYQWSFLQIGGRFVTEAVKSGGTVMVTNNSRIVSGSGTSFGLNDIGKEFRLSRDTGTYKITNVVDQRLEIFPEYVGATASAQPYSVSRSVYTLPPEVGYIFSMVSDRTMFETSVSRLDRADPTRASTASVADCYAYRGRNSRGELQIELYPVPSSPIVITYSAIRRDIAESPEGTLGNIESLILNASAAAGCRVLLLKPNPAASVDAAVLGNLMQAYDMEAQRVLDRVDSLDWTRSDVAEVQGMRDDAFHQSGSFLAEHDTWSHS